MAKIILVKKCVEYIIYHRDESIRNHACGADDAPRSKWTIDGQCLSRFGKDWDEMKKQVFTDLESISKWYGGMKQRGGFHPRYGGSGHWMIDEILIVHRFKIAWDRFEEGKDETTFHPRPRGIKELTKAIRNGYEPTLEDIIPISPQLANKELELMLKSHDLI